jgi:hypothetical protein
VVIIQSDALSSATPAGSINFIVIPSSSDLTDRPIELFGVKLLRIKKYIDIKILNKYQWHKNIV